MLSLILSLQLAAPLDAKALVDRARAARYQQDSSLASYVAIARQRLSAGLGLAAGLGFGPLGRERTFARVETVARVGWDHRAGAWAEVLAGRSVLPMFGNTDPSPEYGDNALVLPYRPGRDRLWPLSELREALPGQDWIVHPLSTGSDSLYEITLGDSMTIRLGNTERAEVVRVRELLVRPKRPTFQLIVGSLWVDVATGALVRAAYRPSVPMDLWPLIEKDNDPDIETIKTMGPYIGAVREVIVEHALFEGRFWLPRIRIVTAEGTAKGARMTVSMEQTFSYERVTPTPPGEIAKVPVDTGGGVDPRTGRVRRPPWRGTQKQGDACRKSGDTTTRSDSLVSGSRVTIMYADGVPFRVVHPCDHADLLNSPLLSKSIYSDGEELFKDTDLAALRKQVEGSLGMAAQSEWNPQPPAMRYGLDRGLARYNRVEGLSLGVMGERLLGKGYTLSGQVRLGTADLEPNAELGIRRDNIANTLGFTAYRRLAVVSDWGNPLGLGASASALLFGKDDGLYYRALGGEVTGTWYGLDHAAGVSWRLFGERHDAASVETNRSLANAVNGLLFAPNIAAMEGIFAGGALMAQRAWGTDPRRVRSIGTARLEAAGGESSYGRLSAEWTSTLGLTRSLQATISGAAGSSIGSVPPQRAWYIGGAQTVRGHSIGTMSGDAFWFARGEIARGHPMFRPAVFADVGWAGPRTAPGSTISGAGVGLTMLDGFVRFDLSRSLNGDGRIRGVLSRDQVTEPDAN